MRTVAIKVDVAAPHAAVEAAWYDTARWSQWVDGLEQIVEISEPWPALGGRVVWRSGPAGRGTVTERVVEHTPGAGQSVAVSDGEIEGQQTVLFTPTGEGTATGEGTRVELELSWALRRRNPLTAIANALFIRRAVGDALGRTLERFAAVVESGPRA